MHRISLGQAANAEIVQRLLQKELAEERSALISGPSKWHSVEFTMQWSQEAPVGGSDAQLEEQPASLPHASLAICLLTMIHHAANVWGAAF